MVFILGLTGGERGVMLDQWKLLYLLVAHPPALLQPRMQARLRTSCLVCCNSREQTLPSPIWFMQAWPWASPRYPSG